MKLKNITKTAVINKDKDPDLTTHGNFLFLLRNAVLALEKRVIKLEEENKLLKQK